MCGEYFHIPMQDLHAVQSDNFNIHKYICMNIVEIHTYVHTTYAFSCHTKGRTHFIIFFAIRGIVNKMIEGNKCLEFLSKSLK